MAFDVAHQQWASRQQVASGFAGGGGCGRPNAVIEGPALLQQQLAAANNNKQQII
jgi:hypothetical protein